MCALTRRDLLRSAAIGAVVMGWDPITRSWATATEGCRYEVPALKGVLLKDEASRDLAADDWGHIVHHKPCAVLRPLDAEDIRKTVEFARAHGIKVSMRGQGHSAYGQSQIGEAQVSEGAGIVIDSATLNQIHGIERDLVGATGRASVDAGVLWRAVVTAAAVRGLTPPALTDLLDLAVGGTLSLGGLPGGPCLHGAQVDNVIDLDVVTGEGKLVNCSPSHNSHLFNSVLGGVGQCGIITRATVKLVRAPTNALMVRMHYDELEPNLKDLAMLARATDRFDSVDQLCLRVPEENGDGWSYEVEAAKYFTPPDMPDQAALLKGLQDTPARRIVTTVPYLSWLSRLDGLAATSKEGYPTRSNTGRFALFGSGLPEATALSFLSAHVFGKSSAELGTDRLIIQPFHRRKMKTPLFILPDSEVFFSFLLTRKVATGDDAQLDTPGMSLQEALRRNRVLYDGDPTAGATPKNFVEAGGKRFLWDAIPGPDFKGTFTQDDWKRHYGNKWGDLVSAKRRYDPDGILGPGQGIF